MKLKNSNCDQTKKLKLWHHSKTQIVIKLKNSMVTKLKKSNCDKPKKNSTCDKTQLVTKLKLWHSSNCDKTQVVTKPKLWQNSNCEKKPRTQMWQNLDSERSDQKKITTKLKKKKITKKNQKIKLWWNSKTQIFIKLQNSNSYETPKLKGLRRLVQLNRQQKF